MQTTQHLVVGCNFEIEEAPEWYVPSLSNFLGEFAEAGDWRSSPYYSLIKPSTGYYLNSFCDWLGWYWTKCEQVEYYHCVAEQEDDISQRSRYFKLVPRGLLGKLIDRFLGGCMGQKNWPCAPIKVAEVDIFVFFPIAVDPVGMLWLHLFCFS